MSHLVPSGLLPLELQEGQDLLFLAIASEFLHLGGGGVEGWEGG